MEEIPIITQGHYFLSMLALGVLVGITFDFYRTCRYFWKPHRRATFVLDLLFSLFSTVLVYMGLLTVNWGEVRMYVFVGMSLGALVYYALLSRFILTIIRKVLQSLITLVTFILRQIGRVLSLLFSIVGIIFTPFGYVWQHLRRMGHRGRTRGKGLFKGFKEKIKRALKIFLKKKS